MGDFVGKTFPTAKGTLTVVADSGERHRTNKLFLVRCSHCSLDKELFPSLFKSVKSSLERGQSPCACNGNKKWSKAQYKIKAVRACEEKDYVFKGFVEEVVHQKNHVHLHCTLCDSSWYTCRLAALLAGKTYCPTCSNKNLSITSRQPDEVWVSKFRQKGKYFNRVSFKRLTSRYWEVTCPVCKEDEYTNAGLCTGSFRAHSSNIMAGVKPCRCGGLGKGTEDKREVKVRNICSEESLIFLGWDTFEGNQTRLKWQCKDSHLNNTVLDSFLQGTRCRLCFEGRATSGFYEEREDVTDTLYCVRLTNIGTKEDFIKIGRSFDISRRVKELGKYYEVEVLSTVRDLHKVIHEIEVKYLRMLKDAGCSYKPLTSFGGHTECFSLDCLKFIEFTEDNTQV